MTESQEIMPGGRFSSPVRIGAVVRRKAGPWSPNVHALLRHLADAGFTRAPRPVSLADGGATEEVGYVPGTAGLYPVDADVRSDEALADVARTLRAAHDASAGFAAPDPGAWQQRIAGPADPDVIGHNDLGPYNIVFDGRRVAAFIDWDFAAPATRSWDACYAAFRMVPLSGPVHAEAFGFGYHPARQRVRLAAFCAAYDHPAVTPASVVDDLAVRLAAMAAHIEREVRAGNPAFAVHRRERHADAYRLDLAQLLARRGELV